MAEKEVGARGQRSRYQRRFSRRPSLPDEVTGLLSALREAGTGKDVHLIRWKREKLPLLKDALQAWGLTAEKAGDLVTLLMEEAFLANARGLCVLHEVAWMAGVLGNLRGSERWPAEREYDSSARPTSESCPSVLELLIREENRQLAHDWAMGAARNMPRPYGHVFILAHLQQRTKREVQNWLNHFRFSHYPPVSLRQVQHLARGALKMACEFASEKDLRFVHRQKFLSKKNPWIVARLPPLTTQNLWNGASGAR